MKNFLILFCAACVLDVALRLIFPDLRIQNTARNRALRVLDLLLAIYAVYCAVSL